MVPVFVLPFLPVLAKAATVAGAAVLTLWALDKMERKYESKKYNLGYEHQRRQDKRNKRALDKAQLNVQNSINNNYNNENDGPPANIVPNSESVDSLKNEDSSDIYELPLEYL